jgi:cystathionine beta-lyase/cystathionine gamma-synthase
MGFATNAIHVGQEPDPSTGAVVAPIYQTSTYVQESFGKYTNGYDYARTNHPNRKALERCVAKLEGGLNAYVFTSGMAGIDAVFRLLRPGDHVIVSESVYGGVYRLSTQLLTHFKLEFSFVDTSSIAKIKAAVKPNTRMIYLETPTNPTMILSDIAATAKLAGSQITLVVDNTFLSPFFQNPIALGAHIVVHSMTKYLNGHSDATGGAVILARHEDAEKIYFIQRSAGAGLAPMDCFLVSRGIKTLAVRMLQHNANGIAVARHLDTHPKVKKVVYPGLPSHPQHDIARKQQKGPGAMIAIELGSREAAEKMLNNVKLCTLAESLGGVETLISHPASMTHASMPADVRQRIGITEGLVRLSVGIEDVEDILADLDQALMFV